MEFDEGDYEQKEHAEPEPPRRRKKVNCRANFFNDAEAGVDENASGDEITVKGHDDLNEFIAADDIEF